MFALRLVRGNRMKISFIEFAFYHNLMFTILLILQYFFRLDLFLFAYWILGWVLYWIFQKELKEQQQANKNTEAPLSQ
jgi:hypothetical protein